MKKKITFKHILKNLDAVITGTTLVACVIIVNLNVIMRYMLSSPLQWSEEIVTSLFVWTFFQRAILIIRKRLLSKWVPARKRRIGSFICATKRVV